MLKQAKKSDYYDIKKPVTNESQLEHILGDHELERKLEEFVTILM